MERKLLKSVVLAAVAFLAPVIFLYPFPETCYDCSIFQKLSSFLFNIFGVTAFCLPLILITALFVKGKKVQKYLKLSLLLWIPVLINLALVRDLLEIGANIGGIAGLIFTFAHNNKIDFIFIFIPILAINLLILYLLGLNIPAFFRRIVDEVKSLFGDK
jgi:hypothetical protein